MGHHTTNVVGGQWRRRHLQAQHAKLPWRLGTPPARTAMMQEVRLPVTYTADGHACSAPRAPTHTRSSAFPSPALATHKRSCCWMAHQLQRPAPSMGWTWGWLLRWCRWRHFHKRRACGAAKRQGHVSARWAKCRCIINSTAGPAVSASMVGGVAAAKCRAPAGHPPPTHHVYVQSLMTPPHVVPLALRGAASPAVMFMSVCVVALAPAITAAGAAGGDTCARRGRGAHTTTLQCSRRSRGPAGSAAKQQHHMQSCAGSAAAAAAAEARTQLRSQPVIKGSPQTSHRDRGGVHAAELV